MKRNVLLVVLILFFGLSAAGQSIDGTLGNIRRYYNDISEKARLAETDDDQGQFGDLVMNELVINKRGHQWRAVGIFKEIYKFFYRGGDSEEHMYPDQLAMVKVERHSSNRRYVEEFVYDHAGRLIFYFQKAENDELVPSERRIYFSTTRPIRINEDMKVRDRLTAKDLRTAADVVAEAAKIKDLFLRSIKL